MNETTEMTPGPQRLRALARANEVRLARAELKRKVAQGEISAAKVILECPQAAGSWTVGELLMSQRRWGSTRCRKFLSRNQISEIKRIDTLTERQRRVLAAELSAGEPSSSFHDPGQPQTRPAVTPLDTHERILHTTQVVLEHCERELVPA